MQIQFQSIFLLLSLALGVVAAPSAEPLPDAVANPKAVAEPEAEPAELIARKCIPAPGCRSA